MEKNMKLNKNEIEKIFNSKIDKEGKEKIFELLKRFPPSLRRVYVENDETVTMKDFFIKFINWLYDKSSEDD